MAGDRRPSRPPAAPPATSTSRSAATASRPRTSVASDAAAAVAVQADGKIVVAGSSDGNFALARYGADGALDPSFSGDGLVTTDLGGTDAGEGVAIQADGRIVVVGQFGRQLRARPLHRRWRARHVLQRRRLQTTDFGAADGATAVAIQADGRIVVGGNSGGVFALARYDAAGVLDTSFSGDGKQTTDFGGLDSSNDVAIGADGAIVVVGTHAFCNGRAGNVAVARYTSGGALAAVVDDRLRPEPIHLRQRRRRGDPGRRPHRRRRLRRRANPLRWLLHAGPAARPLRRRRRA